MKRCPKCGSEDINWYMLAAIFHPPETKIGHCRSCDYILTMADEHKYTENVAKQ